MSLVNVAVTFQAFEEEKAKAKFKLIEILVKVGDQIRKEDVLAVGVSDKATIDIFAPIDGKVREIFLKINNPDDDEDVYHHGDILCTIEASP